MDTESINRSSGYSFSRDATLTYNDASMPTITGTASGNNWTHETSSHSSSVDTTDGEWTGNMHEYSGGTWLRVEYCTIRHRQDRTIMRKTIAVACAFVVVALGLAAEPKVSPDVGKAIVGKVYGDVVWSDADAGIVVGVEKEGGRTVSVQIDAHKSGVNLKVTYPKAGGPPVVEYSSGTLGPPAHVAFWSDLNGDGVFDKRTLVGDWALLHSGQGANAWLEGKWLPMRYVERDGSKGAEINGNIYRFDVVSGSWMVTEGHQAAAATQPAR